MALDILAGLTIEHIMFADLATDTAIRLIEAARPENLRTMTKEEANEYIKILRAKRDLLRLRQSQHKKMEE